MFASLQSYFAAQDNASPCSIQPSKFDRRLTGAKWVPRGAWLACVNRRGHTSPLAAGANSARKTRSNDYTIATLLLAAALSHYGTRTMTNCASPTSTTDRPSAQPDFTDRQSWPQVGSVLRCARIHHRLSLREVERRIGRSNVYLSQVERGLIKQPDPIVLLDLAELYGLNFETLATWARWLPADPGSEGDHQRDSTAVLVRQVMELNANERATVLRYIKSILRERRT